MTLICGSTPPLLLCEEIAFSSCVNDTEKLESWVREQKNAPSWFLPSSVVFAALKLADYPSEGAGHLSKTQSMELERTLEKERKKSLAKLQDEVAKKAFETMMSLAQNRSSDLYTGTGGQRAVCNMHKAFWHGFNGVNQGSLERMKSPHPSVLMASYGAGVQFSSTLKRPTSNTKSQSRISRVKEIHTGLKGK